MNKTIKNLFNKEQMLELNLHDCAYPLELYRQKLRQIKMKYVLSKEYKQALKHVNKVFKSCKKILIPTLDEILQMDAQHIEIMHRNPDPELKPTRIEFSNHDQLLKQFSIRFEKIHKQFHKLVNCKGQDEGAMVLH